MFIYKEIDSSPESHTSTWNKVLKIKSRVLGVWVCASLTAGSVVKSGANRDPRMREEEETEAEGGREGGGRANESHFVFALSLLFRVSDQKWRTRAANAVKTEKGIVPHSQPQPPRSCVDGGRAPNEKVL